MNFDKTMRYRALFFLVAVLGLMLPGSLFAESSALIAKVNGTAITALDVELEIDRLLPRSTFHGGVSESTRASFREKALDNAIEQELQYQDALARGLKPDAGKVAAHIKKAKAGFRSDTEYKQVLNNAGMSEDAFRQRIAKSMLVDEVVEKVKSSKKVTDADVKDYYTKNVATFKRPESVRLSLVSSKNEAKAREMLSLIRSGQDFGSVAARMSEDNYRIKGGDIGYIHRGRVLKEIEDVAFRLKKGEMSELIKGGDTWFVIRVEDKQGEHQMTFDEVKGKLKKDLETKQSKELVEKWLVDLKAKATIQMKGVEQK